MTEKKPQVIHPHQWRALTDDQRADYATKVRVLASAAAGHSLRFIAEHLGLSVARVKRILRYRQ